RYRLLRRLFALRRRAEFLFRRFAYHAIEVKGSRDFLDSKQIIHFRAEQTFLTARRRAADGDAPVMQHRPKRRVSLASQLLEFFERGQYMLRNVFAVLPVGEDPVAEVFVDRALMRVDGEIAGVKPAANQLR